MGRKRRGRRKKVTYDSDESKTVFGIVSLITSVVVLVSHFMDGVALSYAKNLFGGAIFFFSAFFFVLALRLFNAMPEKVTNRTVFGVLFLALAYAVFLSGEVGLPSGAQQDAYAGMYGGRVGFDLAEMLGNFFFRDAVRPFSWLIGFLSIPLILSMSLPEYFTALGKVVETVKGFIGKAKGGFTGEEEHEGDDEYSDEAIASPTMVGDFRAALTKDKDRKGDDKNAKKENKDEKEEFKGVGDGSGLKKPTNEKVNYKETDTGDGVLVQDELQYPEWRLPPVSLLESHKKKKPSVAGIRKTSKVIEQTLMSFNVKAEVVDVLIGPSITQYALNIALGTKVAKIANLRNDLALALATSANAVRIEAPIPGTSYVGIEVPNQEREMITFKELIEDNGIDKGNLMVTIGKTVSGSSLYGDIQKLPHLLIAGATGSGKSVVTNSFIMSLLMKKSPDEVKFILVDPKQVEFSDYNGIPHLLTPVITDMEKVNNALKWAIVEMENRYTSFKDMRVRNIEDFNGKHGFSALPYIVIVIDEMADMMMTQHGAEIESSIVKLAQKARATGIHLILATQRPSVDVITGIIKANIPGRLGMSVTTQIDSRVILDQIGAESLLGRGDSLFKDPGMSRLQRIQAPFVSQEEVLKVVEFVKNQVDDDIEYSLEVTKTQADPNASPGAALSAQFSDDDLFIDAARVVINARKGSSSLIQRKLSVGYNRAARLLDELEEKGIVGPPNGSKPRDILITDLDAFVAQHSGQE